MRRKIIIVRTYSRYPDRSIVCDYCHRRLHRSHFYEAYENGDLLNIYPFHNLDCAQLFVERFMRYSGILSTDYDIEIAPGSEDDPFQEEVTE